MEPEYTLSTLISVIKTDVKELLNTRLGLLKLETFEKTSKAGSFLIYGLIVINLLFFVFLFLFLALGFLIGQWMDNTAGGFAIVALIYLFVLLILFACRQPILTGFQNLFLKELDPGLDQEVEHKTKRKH